MPNVKRVRAWSLIDSMKMSVATVNGTAPLGKAVGISGATLSLFTGIAMMSSGRQVSAGQNVKVASNSTGPSNGAAETAALTSADHVVPVSVVGIGPTVFPPSRYSTLTAVTPGAVVPLIT